MKIRIAFPFISPVPALAAAMAAILIASPATAATWQSLHDVNFVLASGGDEDCGDGALQYVKKKSTQNVRFGARIQFAFDVGQKVTEKNETGHDSGCKVSKKTTATPIHLHRITDVNRCLYGVENYGISEDFAVTDADELVYTYERRASGKTTKKFRCVFKQEKQAKSP